MFARTAASRRETADAGCTRMQPDAAPISKDAAPSRAPQPGLTGNVPPRWGPHGDPGATPESVEAPRFSKCASVLSLHGCGRLLGKRVVQLCISRCANGGAKGTVDGLREHRQEGGGRPGDEGIAERPQDEPGPAPDVGRCGTMWHQWHDVDRPELPGT